MQNQSPRSDGSVRRRLLAAAAEIAGPLSEQAAADEAGGTLSAESVRLLEQAGLFRVKLPAVLGGAEADPTTQLLVFEALSRANAAAGWCAMVGATAVGLPGAFLPEAAIAEIFPGGRVPLGAIVAMPMGRALPVAGGYRLTGRWPFASGVGHADWIAAGARVAQADGAGEHRMMVFPTGSAVIHDNWQAAGLQGTGSCDFSVDDLFVPDAFNWDRLNGVPERGGPLYRLAHPGFVANEHAGFALGLARRALDAFVERAAARARGYAGKPSSLAARPVVQAMLGSGDLRLRAARALAIALNDEAWQVLCAGDRPSPHLQAALRGVATHCTEVSLAVVTDCFRHAGGAALYRQNILQQCLRDMNAAAQHLMVSNIAYETLGQTMLGVAEVDPMR